MAFLIKTFSGRFWKRRDLMKNKSVRAGQWALSDEHTVPFFNPETNKRVKRTVRWPMMYLRFYEWVDHMVSVSNNGSIRSLERSNPDACLKEKYPMDCQKKLNVPSAAPQVRTFDVANSVVNEPLRDLGITEDE